MKKQSTQLFLEQICDQFIYCSYCGGYLAYNEKNVLTCDSCLRHIYINPIPANGVILQNQSGKILLVKRNSDPFFGMWDIPGGFVDPFETLEESLTRELEEELGVALSNFSYFTSKNDTYEYQGINLPTIAFIFTATLPENTTIIPRDDVAEAQFFSPQKIPFDSIAFRGVREAVKMLLKN